MNLEAESKVRLRFLWGGVRGPHRPVGGQGNAGTFVKVFVEGHWRLLSRRLEDDGCATLGAFYPLDRIGKTNEIACSVVFLVA